MHAAMPSGLQRLRRQHRRERQPDRGAGRDDDVPSEQPGVHRDVPAVRSRTDFLVVDRNISGEHFCVPRRATPAVAATTYRLDEQWI
jgi:hypothetical protein